MNIEIQSKEEVRLNRLSKKNSCGFFYPQTRNSIIIDSIFSRVNTDEDISISTLKNPKTNSGFLPFVKERNHLGKLITFSVFTHNHYHHYNNSIMIYYRKMIFQR